MLQNLIRTVWTAFDLSQPRHEVYKSTMSLTSSRVVPLGRFLPFLIMFGVALVGFVMAFNVGDDQPSSEDQWKAKCCVAPAARLW